MPALDGSPLDPRQRYLLPLPRRTDLKLEYYVAIRQLVVAAAKENEVAFNDASYLQRGRKPDEIRLRLRLTPSRKCGDCLVGMKHRFERHSTAV